MSYFSDAQDQINYRSAAEGNAGLRKSQIGALHAISAHFSLLERPAVAVLPTGAGKTAVLMLTPYMLGATRTLIITPSRFVREQIASDFKALHTLKLAGALPQQLAPPKLRENTRTISTEAQWEGLREYDVVISTPNSASPAYKGVATPPDDLFDLVLIDEAHHSPAPTWDAVLRAFPNARAVLFTATPFRRDSKEIKGRYVYNYPIQKAFEDGIYGEMIYQAVEPAPDENSDVILAREAERVFLRDRALGLEHILMVRAESKARADELYTIYTRETALRLEVVHSAKSQSATQKVVARLRAKDLDGVICVDMLGEGFDLPNLKIAALHSPHRSLSVTLQFFGRFARVNGDKLGDATFLAVDREIDDDLRRLFSESDVWGKKIRLIGEERIGKEVATREFLDDFEPEVVPSMQVSLQDLSLYSFNLFNHVKVFQVYGTVDLHSIPVLSGFTIEKAWVADPRSTSVFLAREAIRPKWATTEGVDRIEHHLFVIYFDVAASLFFICGTYREEFTYKEIANCYVTGRTQALSLSKINRVLRSYSDLELFNVGMRNRASGTVAESYRQIAGSAAHNAIDKSDAALYHRGHVFGRGRTATGVTTIGISSLSKAWRLDSTKIPGLVSWCAQLAQDISNPAPFATGIQLDHLDAGSDITTLPDHIVLAGDWHEDIYRKPPIIRYSLPDGTYRNSPLLTPVRLT